VQTPPPDGRAVGPPWEKNMPKPHKILHPECFRRQDGGFAFVLDLEDGRGCVIGRFPDTEAPGCWDLRPRNLVPTGEDRLAALRAPMSGWTACAPEELPEGTWEETAAFASSWTKDKRSRHTGRKGVLALPDGRLAVFEAGTDLPSMSGHEKVEALIECSQDAGSEFDGNGESERSGA